MDETAKGRNRDTARTLPFTDSPIQGVAVIAASGATVEWGAAAVSLLVWR
jgi:hypothetical protein